MATGSGPGPPPGTTSGGRYTDVTCPSCGERVSGGYRFCGECGAVLVPPSFTQGPGQVASDVAEGARKGWSPGARRARRVVLGVVVGLLVVRVITTPEPATTSSPAPTTAAGADASTGDQPSTSATPSVTATGSQAPVEVIPQAIAPRWRVTTGLPLPAFPSEVAVGADVAVTAVAGGVVAIDIDRDAVRWRAEIGAAVDPQALAPPPMTPVIAGDTVVVSHADGVIALDLATGRQRWRAADLVGSGFWTPAVAGGAVVVTAATGRVSALDLDTGAVRWSLRNVDVLGGTGQGTGYSDAPIIADGVALVIPATQPDAPGPLVALDLDTGAVRWRSPVPVRSGVAPVVADGLVHASSGASVIALDVATGAVAGTFPIIGDRLVAGADRVLALRPEGVEVVAGPLLPTAVADALDPSEGGFSTVIRDGAAYVPSFDRILVVDLDDGAVRGSFPLNGPIVSRPTVTKGRIFVPVIDRDVGPRLVILDEVSLESRAVLPLTIGRPCDLAVGAERIYLTSSGVVTSVDAATGLTRWTYGSDTSRDPSERIIDGPGGSQDPAVVGRVSVLGDVVLVVDITGRVVTLDRETGTPDFFGVVGGSPNGEVAAGAGGLFATGGASLGLGGSNRSGYVRALDPSDGRRRWIAYPTGAIQVAAAVAGDNVIVATTAPQVVSLDAETGEQRWGAQLSASPVATPLVTGDRVVVRDVAGGLTAVALASGEAVWQADLGPPRLGSPVAIGGLVVATGPGDTVVAFDAGTGDVTWTTALGTPATSAPGAGNGRVYVGVEDRLVELDAETGRILEVQITGSAVVSAPVVGPQGSVLCLADGAIEGR